MRPNPPNYNEGKFNELVDEVRNGKKVAEIEGVLGFKAELFNNGLLKYYKGEPYQLMPFGTFSSAEMEKKLFRKPCVVTIDFKGKKNKFIVCEDTDETAEFVKMINSQITQGKIIDEVIRTIKTDLVTSNIANKINDNTNSLTDELEKAHDLYEKGILTEDEFNEIKKKIINK